MKRIGPNIVLDIEESNRFGRKAYLDHPEKDYKTLPYRTDTTREKDCDLPQFGLLDIQLITRCKGLYRVQLPVDHKLPWPKHWSDIYKNEKTFLEQYNIRAESAAQVDDHMLAPLDEALEDFSVEVFKEMSDIWDKLRTKYGTR